MFNKVSSILQGVTLALLLMGLGISVAQAGDDEKNVLPAFINAKWKDECSGCHIAYPPRFLPANSWREVMSGLDKHFGSNASLDLETAQEITAFLEKNADQRRQQSAGKLILRISETRWFKSAHEEVSSRAWKKPQVKSAANCIACHRQADLGDFSERDARIPR